MWYDEWYVVKVIPGEFEMDVELETAWFSLVALSYQPPLNTRRRSYVVYVLTISTTYEYYGHNCSYLTTNYIDRLLPTKQKKTIDLDFHPSHIVPNLSIF